jgi:membrane protein DedA with SNARE-associated domain
MIQKILKQHWITISLVIIGGVLGYAYWYYIGCTSGTCALKSVWYYNTGFGLLSGYVIGDFIHDFRKKKSGKIGVPE